MLPTLRETIERSLRTPFIAIITSARHPIIAVDIAIDAMKKPLNTMKERGKKIAGMARTA